MLKFRVRHTVSFTCRHCDYNINCKSEREKNMKKRLHKKQCKYDNIKEEGIKRDPLEQAKHLVGGSQGYTRVIVDGKTYTRHQVNRLMLEN